MSSVAILVHLLFFIGDLSHLLVPDKHYMLRSFLHCLFYLFSFIFLFCFICLFNFINWIQMILLISFTILTNKYRIFVLLFILLLPPLASYLRIPARKRELADKAWSKALCSPGSATTNPYSNCLEVLQIQPSKVGFRVYCSWSLVKCRAAY